MAPLIFDIITLLLCPVKISTWEHSLPLSHNQWLIVDLLFIFGSTFLLLLSVTLLFRHKNVSLFGDLVFLGKICVCIFINCLSEEIGSCVHHNNCYIWPKLTVILWFCWKESKCHVIYQFLYSSLFWNGVDRYLCLTIKMVTQISLGDQFIRNYKFQVNDNISAYTRTVSLCMICKSWQHT